MAANFSWAAVHWPALAIGAVLLLAAVGLRRLTHDLAQGPWMRAGLAVPGLALAVWAVSQGWVPKPPPLPTPPPPRTPFSVADCMKRLVADPSSGEPGAPASATAAFASAAMAVAASASGTGPAISSAASASAPMRLPPGAMGLLGGQGSGTYAVFARVIAELGKAAGVEVVPLESSGTFENLRRMLSKENAAFGFAQADMLAGMTNANKLSSRVDTLRLVLPLYPEEFHVLARLPLRQFSELAGRRIVTSSSSEGSRHTAANLFRHFGIQPAGEILAMAPVQALCAVLADDGQADAVVSVAGKPVPLLADLDKLIAHAARPLRRVGFVEVPMPDVRQQDLEAYEAAQIATADYPWLPASTAVKTVSVRALLMDFSARDTPFKRLRCDQLARVVRALRASERRLRQPPHHPAWRRLEMSRAVKGWRWDSCSTPSTP